MIHSKYTIQSKSINPRRSANYWLFISAAAAVARDNLAKLGRDKLRINLLDIIIGRSVFTSYERKKGERRMSVCVYALSGLLITKSTTPYDNEIEK